MKKTSALTYAGITGALYTVFTIVPALIPSIGVFLYGSIQFRISEALCILPFFMPSTAWGLFIGCMAAIISERRSGSQCRSTLSSDR